MGTPEELRLRVRTHNSLTRPRIAVIVAVRAVFSGGRGHTALRATLRVSGGVALVLDVTAPVTKSTAEGGGLDGGVVALNLVLNGLVGVY